MLLILLFVVLHIAPRKIHILSKLWMNFSFRCPFDEFSSKWRITLSLLEFYGGIYFSFSFEGESWLLTMNGHPLIPYFTKSIGSIKDLVLNLIRDQTGQWKSLKPLLFKSATETNLRNNRLNKLKPSFHPDLLETSSIIIK